MDHSLLRVWLGLPPGPWPPDHYTLLALRPGHGDPTAVEPLVLERMARLRPHQLLHPELVTEGMNRLAQALICLTDSVARAAYDAELGLMPQPTPSRAPRVHPGPAPETEADFLLLLRGLGEDSPRPATDAVPVVETVFAPGLPPPEPLPPAYEVVEPEPLPPAYELVPYEVVEDPEVAPVPPYEVVEAELVSAPVVPAVPWRPANRRQLYARLVALRRLLAAWGKLQPILANPREPLDRPIQVLTLIEAAEEVRLLLMSQREIIREMRRPGSLVVALVCQPLLLATLRTLLPDQRRAVAIDWRRAQRVLEQDQTRLRELARSRSLPRRRARRRGQFFRWIIQIPECVLLVLAVLGIAVLLLRTLSDLNP